MSHIPETPSAPTPYRSTLGDIFGSASAGVVTGLFLTYAIWLVIFSPVLALLWLVVTIRAYRKTVPATQKKGWWLRFTGSAIAVHIGAIATFDIYDATPIPWKLAEMSAYAIVPVLLVAVLERVNRSRYCLALDIM